MKPTMMPPAVPMSTPTPPSMAAAPMAMKGSPMGSLGGTAGPVTAVAPSAGKSNKPSARFNPDNQLPPAAFHKPGMR